MLKAFIINTVRNLDDLSINNKIYRRNDTETTFLNRHEIVNFTRYLHETTYGIFVIIVL